ncbi:MAG: hypothetical protein KGD58_00265 [Candidatus Lokiarchaeota archaeon]|nr:hypothetical protein [Candidatus Lokiarchaeota archaeon]
MAVTKLSQDTDITPLDNSAKIQFICPVCKSEKALDFPKSVITNAKGLTTMSIAKGLVCKHQFQAFVDKNYMVRGYQRVDFEFEKTKIDQKYQPTNYVKDDKELFENLILEGNYLEYKPNRKNLPKSETVIKPKEKSKSLKELYDEFWEFIDEKNEIFSEFIKNDDRRKS